MFVKRLDFLSIFLLAALLLFNPVTVMATTLAEYFSKSKEDRDKIVLVYVDSETARIKKLNPQLSEEIHRYFYDGKGKVNVPVGMIAVEIRTGSVRDRAIEKKVSLDKIDLEKVIYTVIKDKFSNELEKLKDKN